MMIKKNYNWSFPLLAMIFVLLLTDSCQKNATSPPGAATPTISATSSVSSITATTASSGGNVTSDGGATVTSRGVCWSTSTNPTISNSKTTDGTGTGSFTSSLTGLTASTAYYVRAYATNSVGTTYGTEVTFTSTNIVTAPSVTTSAASNIASTTAISGGNVSSDGGAAVTARGICWNTSANPTTSNFKSTDGTGAGTFTSSLTGLTPVTTYYIRAYAINSVGTTYGTEVSFTSTNLLTAPTVTTSAASNVASTTASCGGNISSDGGATVTSRGVCWSTSTNPTISNSKTTDGTGTGIFISSLTGLTAATTYYVRAYATNSVGTVYGAQVSFTSATVGGGGSGNSVTIGTQVWTLNNLDVTTYRNGDAIPQVTDPTQWAGLTTGAWCYYNNDLANGSVYGKLYNWYAVNDPRGLAPQGWHIPSDDELTTLTTFLGGESVAGGKMKETGLTHWRSPNTDATNESGFTGLPGGYRSYDGVYANVGGYGYWWSSTQSTNTANGDQRILYYSNGTVNRSDDLKADGKSVRCIKD